MRVLLRDSMDSKLFAAEVSAAYAVDCLKYSTEQGDVDFVDFDYLLRMESGFGDLYIVFASESDLESALADICTSVCSDLTEYYDRTFLDPDYSDLSRIIAVQLDLATSN